MMSDSAASALSFLVEDPAAFTREQRRREPVLTRASEGAGRIVEVDQLDRLLQQALRKPFFRLLRSGLPIAEPLRSLTVGSTVISDVLDVEALRSLMATGATLALHSVHQLDDEIARYCAALSEELGCRVQCNAYITPGSGSRGLDHHHDTHDVFVVQVAGRKRWLVHEPVLSSPLPHQPRSGADMLDGAKLVLDTVLESGDCLYLPRGYVHAGSTTDVSSVHVTLGLIDVTWYDIVQRVARETDVLDRIRGTVPYRHGNSVDSDQAASVGSEVATWLTENSGIWQRLAETAAYEPPPARLRPIRQFLDADYLVGDDGMEPRHRLTWKITTTAEALELELSDRILVMPRFVEGALRSALAGQSTPKMLANGEVDVDDAIVLARRLIREGVLCITNSTGNNSREGA